MGRNPPKEADHVRISFARQPELTVNWCDVGRVTIDVLPDVALLEIFDFYVDEEDIESWHTLVHVCRKWRNLVLGSPRRLNLRLCCTARTPVRKTLDVWPPLPIVVMSYGHNAWDGSNIIATLEHIDRIRGFSLFGVPSSLLETVLAVMQQPYPALTDLKLHCEDETMLHIPDSFLGASAPRLQLLKMNCVSFPGLPKLLLSAIDLVTLRLHNIPRSGYFSPGAMVTCLSVLTSLKEICLEFESHPSRPDWESRRSPARTRVVVPALTYFRFKGVSEYLDDLVVHIDAPRLNCLYIVFFNQINFDTAQLGQFISRTPRLMTPYDAHMVFDNYAVLAELQSRTSALGYGDLKVKIFCREVDLQLSTLARVCTSSLPPLSTVETLYIERPHSQLDWKNNVVNTQWLEFLRPFVAVRSLYVSREFTPGIVSALQTLVGGRVKEVLPALERISLGFPRRSGPVLGDIRKFAAARRLSGHPIAISEW